ncbi:hypothetical protein DFJ74DRAFT_710004 [Hyaloraphidium curvatum]|nr:hypothetical protein DFJ74DRAFT_710004 [Hyaloraphidium curvatum]
MSAPVVLITGCSDGGIGSGLCLAFRRRGAKVYASARRVEAMAALPPDIERVELDVTKPESIKTAVNGIIAKEGRIDVLVNNAGGGGLAGPLVEVPLDSIRELFEMNVWGLLAVTQEVAPHMVRARKGQIVNMGSLAGELGIPFAGAYGMSKCCVKFASDALRSELAPFGVGVTLVKFGFVESNIGKNREVRFGDFSRAVPGTLWRDWLPRFDGKAAGGGTDKPMPQEQFCDLVVGRLLPISRAPRDIWAARPYMLVWFVGLLPWFVQDFVAKRMFGLSGKAKAIEGASS